MPTDLTVNESWFLTATLTELRIWQYLARYRKKHDKDYHGAIRGIAKGVQRPKVSPSVIHSALKNMVENKIIKAEKGEKYTVYSLVLSTPNTVSKAEAAKVIYEYYIKVIGPKEAHRIRGIKNIKHYLIKYPKEKLSVSVQNYKSVANGREARYRKNPANFFAMRDPLFVEYLPENFRGKIYAEPKKPKISRAPTGTRVYRSAHGDGT